MTYYFLIGKKYKFPSKIFYNIVMYFQSGADLEICDGGGAKRYFLNAYNVLDMTI